MCVCDLCGGVLMVGWGVKLVMYVRIRERWGRWVCFCFCLGSVNGGGGRRVQRERIIE